MAQNHASLAELVVSDLKTIEEQHRLIFRLAEGFEKDLSAGRHSAAIAAHFGDFMSYMALHFATEERVMLAIGYSGFAEHRQEHIGALAMLRRLEADHIAGRENASQQALQFIQSWMTTHTNGTDNELLSYLDDANASETAAMG